VPLEIAGITSIDMSDSRPLTGLRRQDLASLRAASVVNACSRTGSPDWMLRR